MMHSAITGGSNTLHSQQPITITVEICGCAEHKDKIMGHIWDSYIYWPPLTVLYTHNKLKDVGMEPSVFL